MVDEALPGIEVLRARRGAEQVTFADVADHLQDFADAGPGRAATVDELARFLAAVETVSHSHETDEVGTSAAADIAS